MSAFDLDLSPDTLTAARKGVASAQGEIYRRFQRPAYTLARRMVGDPDAAADVLQDAFVTAFRTLVQFRGDSPFGHWLRRVVASHALMHLRARRRFDEIFTPTTEAIEDTFGEGDVHRIDLEEVLSALPELPRAILWLYHVEGYTHAEIAQLCDRSVSFSKSQLSRAHARLREQLSGSAAGGRHEAIA